ncbi:MAG: tetratricopeptide repeat protein [Campylobacterota bacterium]|nr:tetratricopeptide repeat protein [Campylobacterota bacterium]
MKKSVLLLLIASYLFAGSYENGIEYYKKTQFKQALESFTIASNNNDDKAMLALSVMHANGDGVTKDSAKSIQWLKKSANLENEIACYRLGEYYAKDEKFEDAFKWFKIAADKGNNKAQYNLGYFYTGGLGVKMSLKDSLYWYEASAMNGNIDAMLNVGFMYIGGQGTPKNYKQAAVWIKKAKDAGNAKAQMMWDEFKLGDYQ